jgi:hypothetical protein
LTQTCSPSALVLGANEAGPGLFVDWLSKARSLLALGRSAAQPLQHETALAFISLLGFYLFVCSAPTDRPLRLGCSRLGFPLLGLLGSGRFGSDTLGLPSSDRSISAWPFPIGLLRLAILMSVPSARPSWARLPRSGFHGSDPLGLGPLGSAPPAWRPRLSILGSGPQDRTSPALGVPGPRLAPLFILYGGGAGQWLAQSLGRSDTPLPVVLGAARLFCLLAFQMFGNSDTRLL